MPIFLLLGAAGVLFFLTQKGTGTPAAGSVQGAPPPPPGVPSTTGLSSSDVATAVKTALAKETDPNKLAEFADSLLPDFSQFAQSLSNRADQLSGASPSPSPAPPAILPSPAPYVPPPSPAPEPVPVPNPPPSPVMFPYEGSTAFVITASSGPDGSLNIRDTPDSSGNILTKVGHGTAVTIDGDDNNGWLPVVTPLGIEGWASEQYLGAEPPADAIDPSGQTGQELPIGPQGQGTEVLSHS